MGDARRRGTREERVAQAIAAGRIKLPKRPAKPMVPPRFKVRLPPEKPTEK